MTTADSTLIVSLSSTVIACLAALVAFWALARTIIQQIPTIEFLVENDQSGERIFRISASNPTHRLLVLNFVEVLSPAPNRVVIYPSGSSLRGTLERSWEEVSMASNRKKPVFLQVPSVETKFLEVLFKDPNEFEVDFKLHWSKNLPILDRHFIKITRRIKLEVAEVNSRILAATA